MKRDFEYGQRVRSYGKELGGHMEKVKFTGSFPKMHCQTYPFRFADKVKGKGYKTAFRDYVLPELEERFGSVFPKSKGWQHLHRKVKGRADREFLLQKEDERIHFHFVYKEEKKIREEELSVQLLAANMKKFLAVLLGQPLTYTEIGSVLSDKKLIFVNEETLYTQCALSRNKALLQNFLLKKIGDPGVKNKKPSDLSLDAVYGEDTVFPEVLCTTEGTNLYYPEFASRCAFCDIAYRNLRELKEKNLIEMDQAKLRLVNKAKNPEFYVLKNILDEDSTAEYGLITREKEDPMNGYRCDIDCFMNTKSPAFAFFTIKNKEGRELFTKKFFREWKIRKTDLQGFMRENRSLLCDMDNELKEKGNFEGDKKEKLSRLLTEFAEAVFMNRPVKPIIVTERTNAWERVKGGRSKNKTFQDIEDLLEFNSQVLFSGIGGKEITEADIEKAMETARRLEENAVFKFDFTDRITFLRSVAKFADPRFQND